MIHFLLNKTVSIKVPRHFISINHECHFNNIPLLLSPPTIICKKVIKLGFGNYLSEVHKLLQIFFF